MLLAQMVMMQSKGSEEAWTVSAVLQNDTIHVHLTPVALEAFIQGGRGPTRSDLPKVALHDAGRAETREQASPSSPAVLLTLCYLLQGDWSPACLAHPFYFI